MSRIALGTAQFGLHYGVANHIGKTPSDEVNSILALAKKSGIDTLDTAIAYGDSEQSLGNVGVDHFKVVSKLPESPIHLPNIESWVLEQIEASLNRLGSDKLYGLLLHRPSQLLEPQGQKFYKALQSLKQLNLVEKIGISVYSPNELDLLIPRYQFDIVQAPLNLIDKRLLNSGWSKKLFQLGTEIHTRSSFLQGLLLMNPSEIPTKFSRWSPLFVKWHNYLKQKNINAVEACIAYALSIPDIHRVIIGVDSTQQLNEIIKLTNQNSSIAVPDISCDDELLINPSNWSQL